LTGVELKLGERLEVLQGDRRAASMIETITPKGRLVISEPMYGLGRLNVKKNDTLNLSVYRETGILTFTATAENIINERGLIFIEVEIRSKVSRHQRRNYVRFDTMLPVTIIPLFEPGIESAGDREAVGKLAERRLSGKAPEPDEIFIGFTLDISGGGLRFFNKRELARGTAADCSIVLQGNEKIEASVRILRHEYDIQEGNYIMSAKFIGIQEVLRERIIKYIFAEQLRKRRG
jgi:c-di-GMP-binding flagellar brake protein YcgR